MSHNDNFDGCYLNFEALIEEIKNRAINDLISGGAPDEKSATSIYNILRAFNKRGISSSVVIEALMEAFKEEQKDEQREAD